MITQCTLMPWLRCKRHNINFSILGNGKALGRPEGVAERPFEVIFGSKVALSKQFANEVSFCVLYNMLYL